MKPRLTTLIAIDAALAVILIVVWQRAVPRHAYDNLEFIPIVRGLKPVSRSGNFNRARADVFLVHRSFDDLCREMRETHWTEVTAATFTRFDADSPTQGFGVVRVLIFNGRLRPEALPGWSKVVVIRRIPPFTQPRASTPVRLANRRQKYAPHNAVG